MLKTFFEFQVICPDISIERYVFNAKDSDQIIYVTSYCHADLKYQPINMLNLMKLYYFY